ncbi:hypothetical protein AD947_13965 [Acetobacter tropicalis]|uniref:DUF559 domain-containing protein n=1 Tax=Acetobacter tropicalis TaxID=104102 RepID=A0A149TRW0_9PROT|nr:hypothetical protein [Acetobacter tropicalis]KXV55866.1 hypothetical protein AD947_13965 [Acetobacter tropicalis]
MFRSSDDSTPSRFHPTEADLITYRDLARALGAPPSEAICRYLGPAGQHLVFIGESGQRDWARIDAQARARWPDLPSTGTTASDGKILESLPERIVYQILDSLKHHDIEIDLHQQIMPDVRPEKADLTLRRRDAACFIEVIGCCGVNRITRNDHECRGLERFERREAFYRRVGITPVCIFLDLLARPEDLKALCQSLVDRIADDGSNIALSL